MAICHPFFNGENMKYTKHQIKDITKSELESMIDEYIIGFKAERNRQLMKRRLCDGLTFEELAEEADMSVRQVKKIVYDTQDMLMQKVRAEE